MSPVPLPWHVISSDFPGNRRWRTTASSTHKLEPASASVCPSPLIVSNGAENLSAILRAFIQGVVGSYLCATNSKPDGKTVFFRRVCCRSRWIGHNSQNSGKSDCSLSKLTAGNASARAFFRDFRCSCDNCSSLWSTHNITPRASLTFSDAMEELSAVSISLLTIPWEN